MKQIIRLTEEDLHTIIRESIGKILKESVDDQYHDTRHQGKHSLNKFLDNDDFTYIVGKVMEKIDGISKEELLENEQEIKTMIADTVTEVVEELAKDEFGYKYEHLTYGMTYNLVDDIFNYVSQRIN